MKLRELIPPNDLDKKSTHILTPDTIPCAYDKDNLGIGAGEDFEIATVEIRDSKTGKIYGRRSFYQKKKNKKKK